MHTRGHLSRPSSASRWRIARRPGVSSASATTPEPAPGVVPGDPGHGCERGQGQCQRSELPGATAITLAAGAPSSPPRAPAWGDSRVPSSLTPLIRQRRVFVTVARDSWPVPAVAPARMPTARTNVRQSPRRIPCVKTHPDARRVGRGAIAGCWPARSRSGLGSWPRASPVLVAPRWWPWASCRSTSPRPR